MYQETERIRAASAEKLARLKALLAGWNGALVAFSAGVDSTFLLAVAAEVLGGRAVALTAHSPSVPRAEREAARELARRLRVRHLELESHEAEDPRYLANPVDRCYFCKSELYRLCEEVSRAEGIPVVIDGFNADDRRDYRPGHRAAQEREVRSPLADVGFGKDEIRAWSEAYGLPTWDKPQMACLASRIPHGTPITPERLARVEAAEAAVRRAGLRQFRVRDHGAVGRVEVASEEMDRAFALRGEILAAVKGAGFQIAALDLEPFRSGRLNDLSPVPCALAACAGPSRALEPRFDHRDELGLVGEVDASFVTATEGGGLSRSSYDLCALGLGFSFDVTGEGDELILGGSYSPLAQGATAASSWVVDGRYRGFFGQDELKTFFDAGLVLPLAPRVAVGPRLGFGVMYDVSRAAGVFASLGAATAFGEFRGFSIGLGLGFQWRWPS
jgi:uncharacterized protein